MHHQVHGNDLMFTHYAGTGMLQVHVGLRTMLGVLIVMAFILQDIPDVTKMIKSYPYKGRLEITRNKLKLICKELD